MNSICHTCNKKGHLASVCQSKDRKETVAVVESTTTEGHFPPTNDTSDEFLLHVDCCNIDSNVAGGNEHYKLDVRLNGRVCKMIVDTGSAVTILSKTDFDYVTNGEECKLDQPSVRMKSYTGSAIHCIGETSLVAQVADTKDSIMVRVVEGLNFPSLVGRDFLNKFKVPWTEVFCSLICSSEDLFLKYPKLFDDSKLGKLKGVSVTLKVRDDAIPVFKKARKLPFSIEQRFDAALKKFESQGIVEKVKYSEWASPVVPVIKPSGEIRICGDYSTTVNQWATPECYPVPTIEELLRKLQNGQKFTKIDLSQAYHQLELSRSAKS